MHLKVPSQPEKGLSSISVDSGYSVNGTSVTNRHCAEHSGKSDNPEPAHQLEKSEGGAGDIAPVI